MIVLKDILSDLGCENPFDENGNFTQDGNETYNKLIKLLYNVVAVTGRYKIPDIVDELDRISNE